MPHSYSGHICASATPFSLPPAPCFSHTLSLPLSLPPPSWWLSLPLLSVLSRTHLRSGRGFLHDTSSPPRKPPESAHKKVVLLTLDLCVASNYKRALLLAVRQKPTSTPSPRITIEHYTPLPNQRQVLHPAIQMKPAATPRRPIINEHYTPPSD